jgi:outer membrane protein OmpA-like peptidoglycan-associated protein
MKKKLIRNIAASSFVFVALASSAQASDYPFPTEMKVTIERGKTPIYQSGSNIIYPIKSYFSAKWPDGESEFVLTHPDGEELVTTAEGDRYLLQKSVEVGEQVYFAENSEVSAKPIRVLLSGPIAIGHVHFKVGSAKLSADAKTILTQAAGQMSAANLTGAYLVGYTDRTGGVTANLALAKLRVERTASYLSSALKSVGILSPEIKTEFMGEYSARGADGTVNLLERRVTLLLYPKM